MSEKSFRVILVLVAIIWVIFVLVPSLTESLPRAWANVQYFLPGDNPRVTVTVKDGSIGEPLVDVRVQIVTDQTAFVAVTDKNGQAVFESVPAGRALQLRAQKLDYEIGVVANPAIPHRQRARYDIAMLRSYGQRLYVAHETAASMIGFSLLDTASHIVMTPPGAANAWENVPAGDVRVSASGQRMFVLTAPRILSLNMADGTRNADIELARTPISGGLAVDPNGEFVYVLATGAGGRGRWLSSIFARSGQQRFSVEVATSATAVALLTSPDGQRLYVLPIGEQTLTVFDARTGQRTYIVPLGDRIKDAVLSRNGQIIYVLTERSPIPLAITLTGGVRVAPALDKDPNNALVGATRLAVADYQQGHWLCLLLPSTRQVAIIDLDDRTIETVAVGREPAAMAHALSTDNLYVANKGGNSLTVISLNDHTVIDEIDVRSRPSMLIPLQ